MNLDTSGALLENIRFSTGNGVYTFPPSNVVVNNDFYGITERAEYLIVVGSNSGRKSLEIADTDLVFYWSRNEPNVKRFDYDSFSNRWLPLPGTVPSVVGNLSNDSRIRIAVPDESRVSSAPYDLFIDDVPRVSFSLIFIGSASFSNPSDLLPGTVEINSSGSLNFSLTDVEDHGDKPVSFTGQNFVQRLQSSSIGSLPDFSTTDYKILLNPKPASGQIPRIRIGYGRYLTPIEVASESLLSPPPSSGFVKWSSDTGRIKFSIQDVEDNPDEKIYYDGVFLGFKQLTRYNVFVSSGWPYVAFNISDCVGVSDSKQFVIFADKINNPRHYFLISIFKSSEGMPSNAPTSGWCYLDSDTGDFYLSVSDVANYSTWTFGCVNARLEIGAVGVATQFYRSGANGTGAASVPDFMSVYEVSQILSDSLASYPFMMLPTVPLVDSDLNFNVDYGTGKFVGQLVESSDPTKFGPGYLLDLDKKRLKFTYRSSPLAKKLLKAQSSIKLDNAALTNRGITVKKNGSFLPVSEYDINISAGSVEFVEPVGEGDINSVDVSGLSSGEYFTSFSPVFSSSDVGKRLLVMSGDNSGIYDITSFISNVMITVNPEFSTSETINASIRATDEVVADRLWSPVISVPKKLTVYRSPTGPLGTFTLVPFNEYSVKKNVGQISLLRQARPGESIKINYVSIDSEDEGVTTVSTPRTEFALFKVSQEIPIFSVGSKTITFNSSGKTVSLEKPIQVYIEGVTQESTDFTFISPGTIELKNAIESGPVTIDYWVKEANGGEGVFELLHIPIDYDSLKILGPVPGGEGGQNSITVSGNQTSTLKSKCAVLVENKDVLYISSSFYDSSTDLTTVNFDQLAVDDGEDIKSTGIINHLKPVGWVPVISYDSPYLEIETNPTEIFVSGTDTIRMHGDSVLSYRQGTIIDFDGDPYWVLGATYDSNTNLTTIKTAANARRNYINPVVKRSFRPVLNASSEFSTSRSAHINRGFTLAKMGTSSSVLQEGVDYDLSDGGVFKLKVPVVYGDILRVMYVARVYQPAGSIFEFNFAYEIAPDSSNGLIDQKLTMNYNLFAPDSFFYRVETIVSMMPEAKSMMLSSGSASSSGPNTASSPSQQNKDSGLPSPWFDSSHYYNVDVVSQRFLKFYHELIENYEDLFVLIDGRIVGGSSGRFRYDGVLNRVVSDYASILNDIDDSVVLYSIPTPVSSIPIYGKMSETNNLSRIFPTTRKSVSYIGSVFGKKNGDQVGSFNRKNILSAGITTTTIASAFFTSSLPITGGTQFTIDSSPTAPNLTKAFAEEPITAGSNGDPNSLIPTFIEGQKIQVFDLDGNLLSTGEVGMINPTMPYIIPTTVSSVDVQVGSIIQTPADFEGDTNLQNIYTPGLDFSISSDTGQILYSKTPSSSPFQNNPLKGDEIIESDVVFSYTDSKPERVPALDGSEKNDSGRLETPRRRLPCEFRFLLKEKEVTKLGFAKYPVIGGNLIDVNTNVVTIPPGTSIQFINGPNTGLVRSVVSHVGNTVVLSSALSSVDSAGSDFVVDDIAILVNSIVDELSCLGSEIDKLDNAIEMFGTVLHSGSGFASSTSVWTDSSFNFTGMEKKLLRVTSGPSNGLYFIESVSGNSVTVNIDSYPSLVVGPGSYSLIDPWVFLKDAEFKFVADFYRNTLDFINSTLSWFGNLSVTLINERFDKVKERQNYLVSVVGESGSLTSLMKNGDNLYETRYTWIDQRANKQNGLSQLQAAAMKRAVEMMTKVIQDQIKAYMMDSVSL